MSSGNLGTRPRFRRTNAEANQAEDLLVATEEIGAQTGGQIRTITPRTHQAVQPAFGQMRIGLVRFGNVAQHR